MAMWRSSMGKKRSLSAGLPLSITRSRIKPLKPVRSATGEFDCARPLLRSALMIAPYESAAGQCIGFLQQLGHHPDSIPQKAAIARVMHQRSSDGAVQPHHLADFDLLVTRVDKHCPIDRFPSLSPDCADRLM